MHILHHDDDLDSTDDAVNDYNDDEAEDDDEAVPTLMPTTAEEDKVEGEEVDEEYTNTKECTAYAAHNLQLMQQTLCNCPPRPLWRFFITTRNHMK